MKIVAGCPVAERAWVLQDWINSLRQQEIDAELEIVCVYTHSIDSTLDILQRNDVVVVESPMPTRPWARMMEHAWSYYDHEYEYMASLRNELRTTAIDRGADMFFSIDSDIFLPKPTSLHTLIVDMLTNEAAAIAPLVNMDQHLQNPPAWNYMDLRFNSVGADRPGEPNVSRPPFQVGVIMAAMLLGPRAMLVPWSNHPQGEDIGWSIRAHRADLKLVIDTAVRCEHRMRYTGVRSV